MERRTRNHMNEKRREIIVHEIQYWKHTKLLPEQYCDYLLALYTEGAVPSAQRSEKPSLFRFTVLSVVCLLIPITILVIYFTELSIVLQMLLFLFFVIICLGSAILIAKKNQLVHFPLISGAVILFLGSVQLSDHFIPIESGATECVVLMNCLLWLFAGVRLRLIYFKISGLVGLFLLFLSFFL